MTDKDKIEIIKKRARKNFSKGYNCSECVFEAVFNHVETGLPRETMKVATGFGGGIGLFGDTCGAITGAVLAVSAVYGRSELPDIDDATEKFKQSVDDLYGKPGLYRIFNQIPNEIHDKFGHTTCRDITSKWKKTWLCKDHALYCRELITEAAGIAADIILAEKEKVSSESFGKNVENLSEESE